MMGKVLSAELSCTRTDLVTKGNNFCKFLFAFLDDISFTKWDLKEKNLLVREQIISLNF